MQDVDCIGNDVVVDREIKKTEKAVAEAENFVQAALTCFRSKGQVPFMVKDTMILSRSVPV